MGDKSSLWVPDKHTHMDRLDEVVKAHALFLEVRHPEHRKPFLDRLGADPHAAWAEAAVFAYLRQRRLEPDIAEDLAGGGPDFRCDPKGRQPFLVEVASLAPKAVEQKSGLPEKVVDQAAHVFGMITPQLQGKVKEKAKQVSGQDLPGVLAICLSHPAAAILIDTLAAQWLMISEPKLKVAVGEAAGKVPTQQVTDLKNAAFFKPAGDSIVATRQSISAIILVAIYDNELSICGLLHPEPAVPFDYGAFGDVPFLQVKPWPIEDGKVGMEWVIAHPEPARSFYSKVELMDEELKGR